MPFNFAKRSSYVREQWESDEKNVISCDADKCIECGLKKSRQSFTD